VPSSRAMFDMGVPLVYLPGYHVGAQLKISLPEMERFVAPRGAIGALLHDLYVNNPLHGMFALSDTARRTWVIWDIICIAWVVNPDWVPTFLTTSPVLTEDLHWRKDEGRHLMREAHDIQRDEIFLDFYDSLPSA
jgi:purine nucleosidase